LRVKKIEARDLRPRAASREYKHQGGERQANSSHIFGAGSMTPERRREGGDVGLPLLFDPGYGFAFGRFRVSPSPFAESP
jgi:hypothetical protein